MAHKLRSAIAAVAVVLLAPGCGLLGGAIPGLGGGGPKVPPVYGPYEAKNPGELVKIGLGVGDREIHIQSSIDVPPDRGVVPLRINAHGSSFDSAASQMTKVFADLKKIGSTSGCGFKITNYWVPNSSDNKKWTTGGGAEVYAEVTGKDPDQRIVVANTCFKALREYILGLPKYNTGDESGYEVLPPSIGPSEIWSVESLEKHRDALVAQANDRLKQVQKADAKMWDHADMQCTSAGMVTVASSSSHWVTLQLEMLCPVAVSEVGSGPGKVREGATGSAIH